jgi:hypothetical protein
MSSISTNITNKLILCPKPRSFHFPGCVVWSPIQYQGPIWQIGRSSITSPFCFLSVTSSQPVQMSHSFNARESEKISHQMFRPSQAYSVSSRYPSWKTISFLPSLRVSITKKPQYGGAESVRLRNPSICVGPQTLVGWIHCS